MDEIGLGEELDGDVITVAVLDVLVVVTEVSKLCVVHGRAAKPIAFCDELIYRTAGREDLQSASKCRIINTFLVVKRTASADVVVMVVRDVLYWRMILIDLH
ncbi:hypothetical protein LTR49_023816 [Elasticomyces elasticus]|nr:hypothetical protein LTR49_023816 [Elasticomyces elasticus]